MKRILYLLSVNILTILIFLSCGLAEEGKYDPECQDKKPQFGDVEIRGSFAHDLGCQYIIMLINGKSFEYDNGTQFLAKKFVKEDNSKMIVELIDVLYLQHAGILRQVDESFEIEKKKFTEQSMKKIGNYYQFTAWIVRETSMVPTQIYSQIEFRIDSSGLITEETLDEFVHEL